MTYSTNRQGSANVDIPNVILFFIVCTQLGKFSTIAKWRIVMNNKYDPNPVVLQSRSFDV